MAQQARTARTQARKATTQQAPRTQARTARTQATTQQATTQQEIARQNVAKKAKEGVGVTHHTNGKPIKGLAAEPVVARPQRKMLRVISKIHGHPGKGNCVKRFHLYKEGMTLLDAKRTDGLIQSDITFYAENGYLELREATDKEYEAAIKEWEASKQGSATEVA